jgi:Leucine-rich repeat (LRR) protein
MNLPNSIVQIGVYYCGLTEIMQGAFQRSTEELIRLKFKNNNMERIKDYYFDYLDMLQDLTIRACKVKSIAGGAFQGFKNLTALDMSENYLTALEPNIFANLDKLAVLLLSKNRFEVLHGGLFKRNYKLFMVKFGGNKINAVDRLFFGGTLKLIRVSFRWNPVRK